MMIMHAACSLEGLEGQQLLGHSQAHDTQYSRSTKYMVCNHGKTVHKNRVSQPYITLM